VDLDDYDGLVDTLTNYHYSRQDLVAAIPVHIKLFEAKANRTLKCRQMETRSYTDVLEAPTEPQYISLPSDFQTMRTLRIVTDGVAGAPLKFRTFFQLNDIRNQSPDMTGDPAFFTVFGTEMELFPEPAYPLRLEMVYRCTIPALTASAPNNWLFDAAPDAYLYGALMEAAPYMREDERVTMWAQGLAATVGQLNDLSNDATYNSGPLTMSRRRRGY